MIPLKLTLRNFLSYREATLDFQGIHTACICGANGAGKSSLLEAIAWAVWGQSRAATEDDVVHLGMPEAQVDFIFQSHGQIYRILRMRQRGQGTTLEFQMAQTTVALDEVRAPRKGPMPMAAEAAAPYRLPSFRSLTAKGVRATQQLIQHHLKLDYETFVNSAYLRQGRADEFMLKRPAERKQILADVLKLNQYDALAERAKDRARQLKGQVELLEQQLTAIDEQLQAQDAIAQEQATLEATLAHYQHQQTTDQDHLHQLQAIQHQRQTWQQQLTWQQQQQRMLEQDGQRLQQELTATRQQQQDLDAILQQAGAIAAGYAQFQTLQSQEDQFAAQFKTHQLIQTQRQQYQQQQTERQAEFTRQLHQIQTQLETLHQQEQELQSILRKAPDIEAALVQLQQAREDLQRLDQLQLQVSPRLQRRQQLQTQIDRVQARLLARLEELRTAKQQLVQHQQRQPALEQDMVQLSDRLDTLTQRRSYQQQIREKGLERRSFMERLQENQRTYELMLAEVEQKLRLLQPEAVRSQLEAGRTDGVTDDGLTEATTVAAVLLPMTYPPCPLCDRPLDERHWQVVLDKHQQQQQDLLNQLWVIREQLAASEREIQILRQEYRTLDLELAQYDHILEQRGQLQEQLHRTQDGQMQLAQLTAEVVALERSLEAGDYATELLTELRLLDASLQQLDYDEKDHALARGQVDRWRWAEIKQVELKQAQRKQQQIAEQRPGLQRQLEAVQAQLDQQQQQAARQLSTLDQQLADTGYDLEQHNTLRQALRQAQPWQLRYQELGKAQQHYPQVQHRLEQLTQAVHERQRDRQTNQAQIEGLVAQLAQTPDGQAQILALEQQMQQRRAQLDEQLGQLGRLQQRQQQLAALEQQRVTLRTQLDQTRREYRVHQELAQAFGRNGIQALMIENVLPQLEAETNRILGRLSANQLHVQFVTQRASRSSKSARDGAKLIDTLDILIADVRGTRPYETYSGGEAFRVNFAIRLALAQLLAQRSGTALHLLIVDEGFGTQDAEGCDRLVASINAIAPDFACILAVTHVPHLKEAFQSRIEVTKAEQGSQLRLVV